MYFDPIDRQSKEWKADFHAAVTISFGELLEWGFIDFEDESWQWDYYDKDQYDRVCQKIANRFFTREINILPPGEWKRRYIGKMNEIMPKYKLLYKMIEENGGNFMQVSDEYEKGRNIDSDFPQTMLGGNQDYASFGTDYEREKIVEGDFLSRIDEFNRNYKDVDVLILDELEVLFCSILTVSLNAY